MTDFFDLPCLNIIWGIGIPTTQSSKFIAGQLGVLLGFLTWTDRAIVLENCNSLCVGSRYL